jgi:solute carrier family 25 (mitochondrial citrate transporter), member 1
VFDPDPRENQPASYGHQARLTARLTPEQGTTFKAGVRFLSYDTIRNMLMDDAGRLSPARGMVAGMIAGAFESIIAVTPTERIKTAL